jgi:hypothetical protein
MSRPLVSGVGLFAVAVLALILWPSAARSSTQGAQVTLTVSMAGTGTGTITSYPAGISCGTTCSAKFPDGTTVTLETPPAQGSFVARFTSTPASDPCLPFMGGPPGPWDNSCQIALSSSTGDASVQVTFDAKPLACVVPGVEGRALARAKTAIRRSLCAVGKVRRAFSGKVKKGRVISQSPRAHSRLKRGAKVDLIVSKGRR